MLDFLRKRRRSWVITLFLAIIVLVFVLWGVGSFVKEPRSASIAEVNGEVISQREFEIHYQRLIDFYRGLFKDALTEETIKSLNLRNATVEELIQKHLLLQEARRLGLEVSDEELMEAIARIPDFQVNGRFNQNRYLQALRSNRLAPAQFEMERRQQLAIQELYDIIQDNIHVTEAELRERYSLEQERVNFYFIRLSASDWTPQVQIGADEIKNYYERNREALKEPLKVQVEYLMYPFNRFSSQVQVSEKEIEDYYRTRRETKFYQPKGVRLRHILFRVAAETDAKQKEAVRLKAEAVLQEARAGKDFADLAKKYSEDPSAVQGGDAGWFTPGQLLPPLEKAAFSLKKGESSGVVETTLGYHILKVEEARGEKTQGLKEAKEEIVRAIRAERERGEAAKAADADRERAISGTDLSQIAKERGVQLKISPFFSSLDVLPEVGPLEEFRKAAFSLAGKELSSAIEGPSAYYLLRTKQRREPSIPPLGSIRAEIEKRLKETKALELASQKANALMGQLKKEKDIRKVAGNHGLKVEETGWFLRHASELPKIGILEGLRPGGIPISSYQPIADRVYTQKGNLYLLAFKESWPADMERFEKEKSRLQAQALAEKKKRAVQKFVDSLKAKARIAVSSRSLGGN
ncbi:MAG: SurA N-terminal domain-containing protein [Deltaproteobacteria bacterium]|nr:SurA N-terminal domain-containing protein [Deltaproteobacteria bacterium]